MAPMQQNMNPNYNYYMQSPEDSLPQNTFSNLRPTDRLLPIANVSKIMKHPIPKVAKVAKDAKELMQKASSEFIAIVTCMAKEICEQENRKTLTGEDLVRAMDQLGMNHYAGLARVYIKRHREIGKVGKKKNFEEDYEQQ